MGNYTAFSGIICEYNPFHYGHAALLSAARENGGTPVVCIMSGNFVQRGDAAILNKWARAETAVRCGADLVFELPVSWAAAGAERFASGGVALLSALGIPCKLWFGSECGDAGRLFRLAAVLRTPEFSELLQMNLCKGISFASARTEAIQRLCGEETAALLYSANNILGIEYCKAILEQNANLTPFSILRQQANHDQKDACFGWSSSLLREELCKGNKLHDIVPSPAEEILLQELRAGRAPATLDRLERAILSTLRSADRETLSHLPDLSEGLENRLYAAIRKTSSLSALYDAVTTKRYPRARARRLVLSAFLGLHTPLPKFPPYLRLLAMNRTGQELLSVLKKTASLPILTRYTDAARLHGEAARVFEEECRASDLYALASPVLQPCGTEQRTSVRIVDFQASIR